MYRALPTNNKICHKRWVEKCQNIHREKLKTTKSTVKTNARKFMDCSLPETSKMVHLNLRLKKLQKESERYAQIERENTILLSKISAIMQTDTLSGQAYEYVPGIRLNPNQYPILDNVNHNDIKSLNKEHRKRELMRITAENQAILRRIQCKEPHYDHQKWEDERKMAEGYLKNICEFDYTPRSARSRTGRETPRDGRMTARSERSNASFRSSLRTSGRGTAQSSVKPEPPRTGSSRSGPRSQRLEKGRSSRNESEEKEEKDATVTLPAAQAQEDTVDDATEGANNTAEEAKDDAEPATDAAAAEVENEDGLAKSAAKVNRKQPKDRLTDEEHRRLHSTFDQFDKDKSGQIELDEFSSLLDALGFSVDESSVKLFFEQRDQNKDGYLSYDEFANWYALEKYYCLSEKEYDDLKKVFDEFDKDKSGYIDVNELGALLTAMRKPSSPDVVEKILKERDWNDNNSIEIDEFVFWYFSNKV